MPESDRVDLLRRRNDLSRPETIRKISHIARGDRDCVTTFAGVFDLLRGVIRRATFRHRLGQQLKSGRRHQIRMRRDRPIRQLDLGGRFGAAGKGHAHSFDNLLPNAIVGLVTGRTASSEASPCRVRRRFEVELSCDQKRYFGGLSPEGDRLALAPTISTTERSIWSCSLTETSRNAGNADRVPAPGFSAQHRPAMA